MRNDRELRMISPHPPFGHPLPIGEGGNQEAILSPRPHRGRGVRGEGESVLATCHSSLATRYSSSDIRHSSVRNWMVLLILLLGLSSASCGGKKDSGADPSVTTLGSAEVTGQLLAIPGEFPPNDLYNYAYVLKYRVLAVHRGNVQGEEIFVAHYNPLKSRSSAEDENSGKLGGNLEKFKAGDVHRMALESPLEQHWMGGVVDKYFEQKGVRYWAVWTNLADK